MREIVSLEGFWDFWGPKANNTLTLLGLFNIIRVSAWRAWGRGWGCGMGRMGGYLLLINCIASGRNG